MSHSEVCHSTAFETTRFAITFLMILACNGSCEVDSKIVQFSYKSTVSLSVSILAFLSAGAQIFIGCGLSTVLPALRGHFYLTELYS